MNKLQGFYELKSSGLPTVPWREYELGTKLDDNILWTVRSAVWKGDDLNLPRKVGVKAEKAEKFASDLLGLNNHNNLVIYYPFFIAEKSGVLEVADSRIVIEATNEDLWNLVTYNKIDVTITISNGQTDFSGNKNFLSEEEILKIVNYAFVVKRKYKDIILEGKSIFLEWSFAYESDINKNKVGNRTIIFYELRSV